MPTRRAILASLAAAAAAPKLSPVEHTSECLAKIEKLNPKLNAFITVMAEEALAGAKALESSKRRGPLYGMTVAVKDLYDTKGIRTTAASRHFANRIPEEDAEVVRLLKAAGAIIVGKANMDEFAYNYTAGTSHFGAARNPWNTALSPGGSSGGSAVAVAAGMCDAALGSDTGGSIRLPASFCGITGFKPTWGRLSAKGVLPLAWTLDTVGPMTRTAHDAGRLFLAMGGQPSPIRAAKYGICRKPFFDDIDPETAKLVEEAIRGHFPGAHDVPFPALPPAKEVPFFAEAYLAVISAEAWAYHEQRMTASPQEYNPQIRDNIANGRGIPAARYIQARRELERLRATSGDLFQGVDLLLTPTAPGPAFPLGKPGSLIYLRNTALWNLYGLPSISVPCGLTKNGLPVGLQITGRAGEDSLVLAAAARLQREVMVPSTPPQAG
ncbi:MAG: amidase [Acidobacteria bacterium]|nr:amidase [Acidobacteriota bacterium]